MPELFTFENLAALLTLTLLEIVLGIDNIVFIAIITGRLEPGVQPRARRLGLLAAMGTRIVLLLSIKWIMGLEEELFKLFDHGVSGKDLILLAGGLFLLGKATFEIHDKLETPKEDSKHPQGRAVAVASFGKVILQIMLIDVVFSLDSVVTAVGMTKHLPVMITAIVIAVLVMMIFAETVSAFIERHPTLKMLALSFLLLIGVMLVAEGCHQHISRGYIYFAMAFSLVVEALNIRASRVQPAGQS